MLRCSSRMRRESRRTVYVVEQPGRVIRLRAGRRTVFLDIRNRVEYGGEQGLLGLAFDPGYAHEPPVLRRVYVSHRPQHGGAIPVRRREGRAVEPQASSGRSGSVREPQRRPSRVRSGRSSLHEHRRRRFRRRSREQISEHAVSVREAAGPRRLEARSGLVDRGARASESLAVLVRSRDRRSLHRRRRPGGDRGSELHAAGEPRSRELRLGSLRRVSPLRGESRRPGGARLPRGGVQPRPWLQRHRRLRLQGHERGRASEAGTSTATTAAAPCGASGSPTVPRPIFASSRSGSTASAPSARTQPASSSRSPTAARSTA